MKYYVNSFLKRNLTILYKMVLYIHSFFKGYYTEIHMNTAILQSNFRINLPKENRVSDAQRIIDGILENDKEQQIKTIELQNSEFVCSGVNHIDLDERGALVESVDIQGARIFPKSKNNFAPVTFDEIVQSEIAPFLQKIVKQLGIYSLLVLKWVLHYAMVLDGFCEKIVYVIPTHLASSMRRKDTSKDVTNETSYKVVSAEERLNAVSEKEIKEQRVVDATKGNDTKLQVHTTYNTKNTVSVFTIFIQILAIIYVELRYGGRLKDIDSI